jgi:hypothetical protein
MLTQLQYTVSKKLLQEAVDAAPLSAFRWTLNQPTGHFFYDPWEIKSEYKGTIWEKLLESLPVSVGEARLIGLAPATSYHTHADIDDRYHLNISGEHCYLFDFNNNIMHPITADCIWYEMDAGRVHSAGNFGRLYRNQIVVRKLLENTSLDNAIKVKVISRGYAADDARFLFDQQVSPWLNRAVKRHILQDFNVNNTDVTFKIKQENVEELKNILPIRFDLEL